MSWRLSPRFSRPIFDQINIPRDGFVDRIYKSLTESLKRGISKRGYLLRTFARNFSNIDFFLKILPVKVDELVMSEM